MTTKQTILVDEHSGLNGVVFEDYACTLNQTDIKANANKFYIMQIIVADQSYYHFIRYGRIGDVGIIKKVKCVDANDAILKFTKQFKTKTGNNWSCRNSFVKKTGKYFMTEVAYDDIKDIDKVAAAVETPNVVAPSKLHPDIIRLIELISDVNMMNTVLTKLDINVKKLPLGKISNQQIDKAQNLLIKIQNISDMDELTCLSSEFYTYIPIVCGRRKPPVIATPELISKFSDILDELRNMVVAVKVLDVGQPSSKIHPADNIYANLQTDITVLDKDDDMWKHIADYVKNTHAPTHHFKAELLQIYEIHRHGEKEIYDAFTKDIGNKHLLFHGSRMSNFCSILKNGLVLNPELLMPGVCITGKMFGYGNYSACSFSKSYNYCDAHSSGGIAALLLCEYALGKQLKLKTSNPSLNAQTIMQKGYHSTWGMGQSSPSSKISVDDVIIPNGVLIQKNINSSLLYDEFIVYDQRQILQRYLILVKAN